jgi:predicted nucleic acid-binding protein
MILVDTSVWVGHLRGQAAARPLEPLLENDRVCLHRWILGELVLGGVAPDIRTLLEALPEAEPASDQEVLRLIDDRGLAGSGIGWVDAHLLASALLGSHSIWTLDGSLEGACRRLGLGGRPS